MFRPNPRAIDELQRDAEYRHLQDRAAREAVGRARAIAPDGGPRRGYRETLRTGSYAGDPTLESTDAFAHLVEFGSVNNPAYSPLRLAVRGIGLDFRDDAE